MNSLFAKIRSLKPIWDALSVRRRRQLVALQLLSLLAAAAEVANLGAILLFLRLLANPQKELQGLGPLAYVLPPLSDQQLLLGLGLVFVTVVVLSTVIRILALRFQTRISALIAADFGVQVFEAVLARPYRWHLENNSSKVLGFLTSDVEQVYTAILALTSLLLNLSIVVLLGGSLVMLAPAVMAVVGSILLLVYLLLFRFSKARLSAMGLQGSNNNQQRLQIAQEGLGGIRDVLLDSTEGFFTEAYRQRNLRFRLAYSSITFTSLFPRYLIEGSAIILIVAVSLALALSGQGIERQLPLLGTLSLGAYRLLSPLQQAFTSVSNLQANQASIQKLQPFLSKPRTSVLETSLPALASFQHIDSCLPMVQLHNLSFRYQPEGSWVLQDLELGVAPGERLAFVGSTGSGKSTCSDLILGLLAPSSGQVLVNGSDLQATPGLLMAWQARVAHVPQQIYLSDASFAANIAFGVAADRIDMQRVRRAAEQARIAELIESSAEGYATQVGERGVRLSGGQRQRIGIARALYKQAQLLVLDEATSALDNRTEAEVMEAIEALDRQLTVILIAHRLSTVCNCDRIVVLEQGRITGIGPYEELVSSHGGFRAMALQAPASTTPS